MNHSKHVPQLIIGSEEYHCNFGFNSQYRTHLDDDRLRVTGLDEEGEVRIVELDGHPFFIATLFQPELSALSGVKHPLIAAFAQTAAERHAEKV